MDLYISVYFLLILTKFGVNFEIVEFTLCFAHIWTLSEGNFEYVLNKRCSKSFNTQVSENLKCLHCTSISTNSPLFLYSVGHLRPIYSVPYIR